MCVCVFVDVHAYPSVKVWVGVGVCVRGVCMVFDMTSPDLLVLLVIQVKK